MAAREICIAEVLRRCGMPAEEIEWVVTADDPVVVHMLLELHAERLREGVADRIASLRELEAWMRRRSSRAA